MARAAIAFFILALIAFVFGANGVAGLSIEIGKMLLVIFLILALVSYLGSIFTDHKMKRFH